MAIITEKDLQPTYDVIVVGSGAGELGKDVAGEGSWLWTPRFLRVFAWALNEDGKEG